MRDHFFRFWFRFAYPYTSTLEAGQADLVWERTISPFLDEYLSSTLEDAARQHVVRLAREEGLSFIPERIGAWWDGREKIDVVAVGEGGKHVLLGECKWSARPVELSLLVDLYRKGEYLRRSANLEDARFDYALFSRQEFTKGLEKRARENGVLLVTVDDIFA